MGMIPVFVSTTLGTTGACAFDVLSEIGPVAEALGIFYLVLSFYLHCTVSIFGCMLMLPMREAL